MGEWSVYYVPNKQSAFLGHIRDVVDAFWLKGIFLETEDCYGDEKLRLAREAGIQFPEWDHDFKFSGMGIAESIFGNIVPNIVNDLICPRCKQAVVEETYDLLNSDYDEVVLDLQIKCSTCGSVFKAREMESTDTPFTFAQFYLYVSDSPHPDEFDKSFRGTVEQVLGPCREFFEWAT